MASQMAGSLRTRAQELWGRVGGGQNQPASADTFRTWLTESLAAEPELRAWVTTFSDEQAEALAEHLADFCRNMGFELEWLLNGVTDENHRLSEGLLQINLHYVRASYQAVMLHEEVALFRAYHGYLQDPMSRANREFGEHLFGKLVEQGMSEIRLSEHLAASPRMRQQQILQVIQRTAMEHPQTLANTFRTVLNERIASSGELDPAATNGMPDVKTAA